MYDTIIIGAGIAGLTSALYASRKNMKFEVLATIFGGQFMESGEVLNYPGIVKTTGVDFAGKMQEQMKANNIKVKKETVKKIDKKGKTFKITTDKGTYETKTIIVASGARPRKLGVPGEDKLSNKGVTYCAICDGPLFSGMDVAIVGGGDSALEAVDFMKNVAKKIYLVVKGKLTAHEYLQDNLKNIKNVEIIEGETKEVLGDKFVSGLKVDDKELKVSGVIVEIGRIPNTDAFKGFLETDEHNHINIDCTTKTSAKGIFAAGDCASGHEYQYVIAAGQGCMALLKASRYLARFKED